MKIYIYGIIVTFLTIALYPGNAVDLDLESAQHMAIMNNKEIKIKQMTQNVSERKYWMGFSKFLPQLSASYNLSNMVVNTFENNHTTIYDQPYMQSLTLSASQLVFDGGQMIANKYMQFYDIKILSKKIDEEQKRINTTVEALYSEIYFLKKKIEQQEKKLNYLNKEYAIIQAKLGLELITELDYNEFLLKLNEEEIQLSQVKRRYFNLTSEFKYMLGLDDELAINLLSRLEVADLEINEKYVETFTLMTLSHNSQSNSIQLNLYKSKLRQIMTYMTFIPTINMNFNYNFEGKSWEMEKKGWDLGFAFSWNLPGFPITMKNSLKFPLADDEKQDLIDQKKQMLGVLETGGDIKFFHDLESLNRFSEAHIEYLKAQYEQEKYLNETEKNIKKTIKEYNEYIQILRLNQKREKILEKKIEIEKVKFQQGSGRFLDVLQSEMKLFETQITIIDTENKLYKNIINIKNLTGISTDEFYQTIK